MGKCLITKLNESVNNDNLLKIGEFSISLNEIESPSESSQKIQVAFTGNSEVRNVNGNLVLETLDSNYDVEFTGSMKLAGTPIDVNANYSGRKGAGAEFMEIVTRVDQTSTQASLQLRLDALNIIKFSILYILI